MDELGATITAEKSRAALDVIEAIFAESAVDETMPVAIAAGASKSLFQDDHQILFLVADVAAGRELDPAAIYDFARRSLQAYRFWDPAQIVGNYGSCLWSDETLKVMFGAMFRHPPAVRRSVERLILVHRREWAAREHLEHAARLLAGEVAA